MELLNMIHEAMDDYNLLFLMFVVCNYGLFLLVMRKK